MKRSLFIMCIMLSAVLTAAGCGSSSGNSASTNSSRDITSFSIVTPSSPGTIDSAKKAISVTVPYGTDVTKLIASFQTTGEKTSVNGVDQTTGVSANDFTSPVTYVVTAVDGSNAAYVVTVKHAANTAADITAFTINNVNGIISGTNITLTLPVNTDLTALYAHVSTTGASFTANGTAANGLTPVDFSTPVNYVVTAADGVTKKTYTVTVTVAAVTDASITSFSIYGHDGVIDESAKTIAVQIEYSYGVTEMCANFSIVGSAVTVGTTAQTSGTTPNDFSSPVVYTVTAADGTTTVEYTVTVTVNSAVINAFGLALESAEFDGVLNDTSISVTVPVGTAVTALTLKFTVPAGTVVKAGNVEQVSGTTVQDFTNPVTYTVTDANGNSVNYTVTVKVAASFTAAGYDGNYAVIWKDGVKTALSDGTVSAEAYQIIRSGNDLYAAGYDGKYAVYWKISGSTIKEIKLSDGLNDASANGIAVINDTVYCSGCDGDKAILWKGSTPIILAENGEAYNLTVSNGDIYVAGALGRYAAYWKNGDVTVLGYGRGTSIAVSGSDVYVAGSTGGGLMSVLSQKISAKGMSKLSTGAVWKNGTILSDYTLSYTVYFGIALSGSDLYLCGTSEYSNSGFWKNGVADYGFSGCQVQGVSITGSSIISAGMTQNDAPAVWIDGGMIALPFDTEEGSANSIILN